MIEALERLPDLKRRAFPRASAERIPDRMPPEWAELSDLALAFVDAHLRHFVADRACPACGHGFFGWGLIHGSGSCACGWPATIYHVVRDGDLVVVRFDLLLWAHPYDVGTR